MSKIIYMDYAATTFIKDEVLEEMMPYLKGFFGNPSSQYSIGLRSKMAIESSRDNISSAINCKSDEVFFTSGATEADNWAIKGFAYANKNKGDHIITTKIEHEAILSTCRYLEEEGFKVTYLPVDGEGFVNLDQLIDSITKDTILVSIIYGNNEIGTIQNIKEIGKICNEKNITFHSDAVQALGKVPIDVKDSNIDMLSMSSHKIYGPKGVGALYVKKGLKLHNILHGGGQERGKRGGTENVASIVGFGKAVEISMNTMKDEVERLSFLSNRMIEKLLEIEGAFLNGPEGEHRLANNINLGFRGVYGEDLVFNLDREGICVSSGSACQATSMEPSHVLLALGLSRELSKSSIRLTIGENTTEENVDYVCEQINNIVNRIRTVRK
ncbi:cysteine desulfurase NifS [Clostridium sp. MSJ-11]|uniref:Cysteine desulfurase n=1 Tax=Clostridium mobile TaxID=2841512 RepID=A0ABS6ECE0_9CLOT|nr:cysteine desulfurase NifS [Clostridium mobile]MBU5482856.1 cysteine desulfurase NifS [Clostridium mobile]